MKNEYLYIPCAHHPFTRRSIRSIVSTLARKATDVKVKREREREASWCSCMHGWSRGLGAVQAHTVVEKAEAEHGWPGRESPRAAGLVLVHHARAQSRAQAGESGSPPSAARQTPPSVSERKPPRRKAPLSLTLRSVYFLPSYYMHFLAVTWRACRHPGAATASQPERYY